MPIKGLIFDAYGTLYDVHSVQAKTEQLCPGKGDLITLWGESRVHLVTGIGRQRNWSQRRFSWASL